MVLLSEAPFKLYEWLGLDGCTDFTAHPATCVGN